MTITLDKKYGALSGLNRNEISTVTLTGQQLFPTSSFYDHLYLSIDSENVKPIYIPYSGYNFNLFLGDFTGDGLDEILVLGDFGGSGNYKIISLYTIIDNKLVQIASHNSLEESLNTSAYYLDDYMLILHNENLNKDYFVPLDDKNNVELNLVYNANKKYKGNSVPTILGISGVTPVKNSKNTYYNLMIEQRVIGQINADTLAFVSTVMDISNVNATAIFQKVATIINGVDSIS